MPNQAFDGSGGNHLARVIERLHRPIDFKVMATSNIEVIRDKQRGYLVHGPVMLQEAGKHRTFSCLAVGKLQLFAHRYRPPMAFSHSGSISRRGTADTTASPQTLGAGQRA